MKIDDVHMIMQIMLHVEYIHTFFYIHEGMESRKNKGLVYHFGKIDACA